MIFKGRRDKNIEPPNQTRLKHLLVQSLCISLTLKPAPFLHLTENLGSVFGKRPWHHGFFSRKNLWFLLDLRKHAYNSETYNPTCVCVCVYHLCKAISKRVYVSAYVPGTSFVFYFGISNPFSKQLPGGKLPIQTGRPLPSWAKKIKVKKHREQMDWLFSQLNSPHSCVLSKLQGPPPTPSTTPHPTSPINTWHQETFKDSAPPLKLPSWTRQQNHRKELQLPQHQPTFLPAKKIVYLKPQTSGFQYLPPTSLEFQELEHHRSFRQVLGRHLFGVPEREGGFHGFVCFACFFAGKMKQIGSSKPYKN